MKFNMKVNCPYSIKLENLYAMKYFLNYGHSNELKILDLQTFYINSTKKYSFLFGHILIFIDNKNFFLPVSQKNKKCQQF